MPRIAEHPSPNHRSRGGQAISLIVLHSDHSGSMQECLDWIADPASHVSYHYCVGRTGQLFRCVPDSEAAFHAGVSEFNGRTDGRGGVNQFSLGVNLSNRQDGIEVYPPVQLAAAADLVAALATTYKIPLLWITTHAECARPIGRKRDPVPGGPFQLLPFLDLVQSRIGKA